MVNIDTRRNLFVFLLASLFPFLGAFGAPRQKSESTYEQDQPLGTHIIYVSPLPGSKYLTPQTNIIVRSDEELSPAQIDDDLFEVVGSLSGGHEGKAILVGDQRTVLFQPQEPFALGETVRVSFTHPLLSDNGDTVQLVPFSFDVVRQDLNADKSLVDKIAGEFSEAPAPITYSQTQAGKYVGVAKEDRIGNELEGLPADFPPMTVTKSDSPSAGYIFLSTVDNGAITPQHYGNFIMMFNNQGTPVYYKRVPWQPYDFTIQPTGELSFACPWVDPTYYVMNTSFQVVDSFHCVNGYRDDGHDFKILPNGNVILLADDFVEMDMSKIVKGGDTAAIVLEPVIQELDKNKNLLFEWRTLDHFNMLDGIGTTLTGDTVDPFHSNAVIVDQDGNILLSTRYLSEITKIDINTGDIIWRLGGNNNQFQIVNDPIGFSWQHDIRRLPDGDITLMDNGNKHVPPFSRAVEYKLDEVNKVATLVWQFRHSPDAFNGFMGSVQRLQNGNTLIGWGGAPSPSVTEVRPDGSTALEMSLPYDTTFSYRAYRFPFLFLTSPTASDTVKAGDTTTLRWMSSGVDSVDIDYSTDEGASWSPLVVNYPSHSDSMTLTVPANAGSSLQFRIVQAGEVNRGVTYLDTVAVSPVSAVKPAPVAYSYALQNNYPNPFNPSTVIKYDLAAATHVTLKVYDILGRAVSTLVDASEGSGEHSAKFDGSKLASGMYFYRLSTSSGFVQVKKMILEK